MFSPNAQHWGQPRFWSPDKARLSQDWPRRILCKKTRDPPWCNRKEAPQAPVWDLSSLRKRKWRHRSP